MNFVTTVGPFRVVTTRIFGDYVTNVYDGKTGAAIWPTQSTNDPAEAIAQHDRHVKSARVSRLRLAR